MPVQMPPQIVPVVKVIKTNDRRQLTELCMITNQLKT
jgi:hypothetical protein